MDAARHSPSGNNKNPWRFVVITERNILEHLSETHAYCRWLASAQAGIALVVDPAVTRYWLEDCCLAAYSIWLAATAQGLGVAWAAIYQSDNSGETERRQNFVRELLSIPDKFTVPILLGVGYPDSLPQEKEILPLEDVFFWEHYGAGNHR